MIVDLRISLRLWLYLKIAEDHKKSKPQSVSKTSTKEVEVFPVARELIAQQITTVKFDGSNYLTWSKSVLIYIESKDIEYYLMREVEKPDKKNPKYQR